MDRTLSDTVMAVLSLALCIAGQDTECPPACPPCPGPLTCPAPSCPPPVCPPLPTVPLCPAARCPALPEVPACPTPQLTLSCPNACPGCPSCPPCAGACPPCGALPNPSNPRPVPPGYQIRPGIGAYKYYQSGKSWRNANSTCGEDGGYLVIPKNMNELLMLLGMMSQTFLHVGFHDTVDEGDWITALGQPMTAEQKSLWKPGEPSSGGSADCAFLSRGSNLMLDGNCNDQEPFVCEIQLR